VAVSVTLFPPTIELDDSVSGAVPVKQASFACGVEVLSVTGLLLFPVKQATVQVLESVQLLVVPRAPPVQE
jgi:hypothetical protein